MTNTAIRRSTGALVAAFCCDWRRSIYRTRACTPVYDQKFLDYFDVKGVPYKNRTDIIRVAKQFCLDSSRQGGSTWRPGTT
jgi:hypothetical protein